MKYYMSDDSEYVFPLEEFRETLIDDDELEGIELFEMKRDIGGQMWCEENEEFIYKGEDCGIQCPLYSPCNGKSGRCRNLKNGFVGTGKEFILNKSGILQEKTNVL